MTRRQLKLNLVLYPGGHHEAARRYPGSQPDRVPHVDYYTGLARDVLTEQAVPILGNRGLSRPANQYARVDALLR